MDLGLAGRSAVVTGASKGIGKAIALALAGEGAHVAICARRESPLRTTEQEIRNAGVTTYACVCDVSDAGQLERFLEGANRALGGIDILVNNASALALGDELDDWRMSLDVDLLAAVQACQKVVPWMIAAGRGSILFVSSVSGLESWGSLPAYSAAKAALISYSKTLAVSLAPHGIRANTIAPGSIEFEGGVWADVKANDPETYGSMIRSIPSGRAGTPAEVGAVAAFLVSNKARWVTGACINVDGGQYKGNR